MTDVQTEYAFIILFEVTFISEFQFLFLNSLYLLYGRLSLLF